jgi:hypothetical protein
LGLGPQKKRVRFWVEKEKAFWRTRALVRAAAAAARRGVGDNLMGVGSSVVLWNGDLVYVVEVKEGGCVLIGKKKRRKRT